MRFLVDAQVRNIATLVFLFASHDFIEIDRLGIIIHV